MEETLEITPKESDLTLPEVTDNENEFIDPLAPNYPTWSSRYKCFKAYICFTMSYLSVLKFCERVGKYKLTILIPYLFFNILIGLPAVLVEIMLGRYVMGNLSQAWNMCPPARGIFWCLFIVTYYAITVNYICDIHLLKYTFASFRGYLVWGSCEASWATENCYTIGKKSEAIAQCMQNHSETYCYNVSWETSGHQFWKNSFENNNVFGIFLSFTYLILSVSAIATIIYKGIRSLEKMFELLVYPSVILWTVFVVVSFRASIALKGFKSLCVFNWSEFVKLQIWLDGFEDTFFLLGLGKLSLSFISSHGKFTDNILLDVLIVTFTSVISCVLLTIPILSIIVSSKALDGKGNNEQLFQGATDGGHQRRRFAARSVFKRHSLKIKITLGGISLAEDMTASQLITAAVVIIAYITDIFISMSDALIFYPYPNTLWSAIYYINCFLISLSSQTILVLSLCEAIEAAVGTKGKTYLIIAAVSVTTFLSAATMSFIKFVYDINHCTIIVTNVLLLTITWQLFYGIRKFNYDYYFMMGYALPLFIKCTWITLLLLPFVGLILKMYYNIPDKPVKHIAYFYVGITVAFYLLIILIKIIMFQIRKQKISGVFMANPDWGPDNALLKRSRLFFEMSTVTREFMYRQELYKKPFIKPPDFSKQNIVQLL